jgi:hypothetical protein
MSPEFNYPDNFVQNFNELIKTTDSQWGEMTKNWSDSQKEIVLRGRTIPIEERELEVQRCVTKMHKIAGSQDSGLRYKRFAFTAFIWAMTDDQLDRIISHFPK